MTFSQVEFQGITLGFVPHSLQIFFLNSLKVKKSEENTLIAKALMPLAFPKNLQYPFQIILYYLKACI
jgi:hypothetical protein